MVKNAGRPWLTSPPRPGNLGDARLTRLEQWIVIVEMARVGHPAAIASSACSMGVGPLLNSDRAAAQVRTVHHCRDHCGNIGPSNSRGRSGVDIDASGAGVISQTAGREDRPGQVAVTQMCVSLGLRLGVHG